MGTTTEGNQKAAGKSKLPANYKTKVDIIKKYQLEKDVVKAMLKNIFLSRKVDDTEINMRKQSQAYFQISGAGHEGILTAVGNVLKPRHDYFLCYYRDRALCLALGVTPYEMLLPGKWKYWRYSFSWTSNASSLGKY